MAGKNSQKKRVASLLGNPAISAIYETRGFPPPTCVEFGLKLVVCNYIAC
jgi:hypothetical protein